MHGGKLLTALSELNPDLVAFAVGGDQLKKAGARLIANISELSVMGLLEVAKKLPVLFDVKKRVVDTVRNEQIQTAILIDFSGFNLRLAESLHSMGVRIFYYVSPQVWASRKGRVEKIRRLVDHMFVIFPFEKEFYEQEGVPVTFVGHPLLDEPRPGKESAELKKQFFPETGPPGLQECREQRVIGLLPGSRESEIRYLYPRMLSAFDQLRKRRPGLRALVPQTPHLKESLMAEFEQTWPWTTDPEVFRRIPGQFRAVTKACDVVVVTSGTATLETALLGVPMVIVYVMNALSYQIAKHLVTVPAIGMVNLVAGVSPEGKTAMPELIQGAATPEAISEAVLEILDDPVKYQTMKNDLERVSTALGEPGASSNAARAMARLLGWKVTKTP